MPGSPPNPRLVAFGRFRFDLETARLFDERDQLVPGPAKALETMRALIERRDRIVSKDELMALVWPDTAVEEANLAQQIFILRKLIGDEAGRPTHIATIARRGYRFVGDVADVIQPPADPERSAPPAAIDLASRRRMMRAAAAAVAVVMTAFAFRWAVNPESSERTVAFDLALPPGVIPRPDLGLAGVSPDGRSLAVIAQRPGEAPEIWVRALAGSEPVPLSGSAGATQPFWSPDGRALGFFQDLRLRVIQVSGGLPRVLCAAGSGRGGTWNEDGTIVFAADSRSPLSRITLSGGTPTAITTLDAGRRDVSHRYPSFLPDGRHFVFLVWSGDVERQGIYLGSLDGDTPVRLLPDLSPAMWAAGHLLFVRRETLVAQPMTMTSLSGEPRVVASPVGRDPSDYVALAASPSGDLVFRLGQQRSQLVWFDRTGRELGNFGPPAHWADPAISPDGTRSAFVHRDRTAGEENLDVWIEDRTRSMRTRVTLDPAIDVLPVWSPDGRELLFRSNRSGFSDLYRKRPDTTASETLVLASNTRKDPTDWSPDGQSILFTETLGGDVSEVWLYDLANRSTPRSVVKDGGSAANGRFSPDGGYVAFESALTGRREVYVQALADGGRRWRVSMDGGSEPAWRGDGHELFFVSGDRITAVDVATSKSGLTFGTPHTLFESPVVAWLRNSMAVSPDGQRFLISIEVPEPRPTQVILKWRGQSLGGDR